ncbi:hypothetical protein GGR50DRAFT_510271 [Xylaria sp. CBS 124048]|nr:hypothetical protein GGR50DRAFT_510271 [Xylaria sp. CBS 124048]
MATCACSKLATYLGIFSFPFAQLSCLPRYSESAIASLIVILYSDKNAKSTWHTNTANPTGDSTCIIAVQNDGNVVIYKGTPIWATTTVK